MDESERVFWGEGVRDRKDKCVRDRKRREGIYLEVSGGRRRRGDGRVREKERRGEC